MLLSGAENISTGKSARGNGFLTSVYQGVQCRSKGDPVLYLSNPGQVDEKMRKLSIETFSKLNEKEYQGARDPEILSCISQYELAFQMQAEVPEVMNINDEPTISTRCTIPNLVSVLMPITACWLTGW